VREVLVRCLDKDPRTRLQDMGEARIALRDGGASASTDVPQAASSGRRWVLPLVLAALAGAAATWLVVQDHDTEPGWRNPIDPTVSRWAALNLPGSEFDVEISSGGETIVFASNRNGVVDVWRCSLDGGNLENLTQGRFAVDDMPVRNTGMKGNLPVFHHALDVEAKLLPSPGARPELAVGPLAAEPDWTRDGSRVVYHTTEPGDPFYVHGVGQARGEPLIRGAVGEHLHYPTWSFDEEWILYNRGDHLGRTVDLYRIRPDGTDEQRLTTELLVSFPTPIDERTVLFLALDQQSAGPWLWSLDLPTLRTRRLTVGLQQYTSLAASGDGRTLVATVASPTASLYRIPIPGKGEAVAGEGDVEPVPDVPSLRAVAPRYAGGELFYLSSLGGGGDGLFMARGGAARELQPDRKEPLIFLPSVSPDGRTVALIRPVGAHVQLSLLDVESRALRVEDLVPDLEVRGDSGWDPTSTWIVVGGDGPDGPGLFRVSVVDGAWVQLASGQVAAPAWSPTEDLIVYGVHQHGPWYTLRGMRSDGAAVELAGEDAVVRWPGLFRFLPDGSCLVYKTFLQEGRLAKNFELLDLRTGERRLLTDLQHRGTIRAFDIAPDGAHVVFDRTEDNSDVVVIRREPSDA
jgi:Tol biopolymer transport system component